MNRRLKTRERAAVDLMAHVALAQLDPGVRRALTAALNDPYAAPGARAVLARIAAITADGAEKAAGGPQADWGRMQARTEARAALRPGWRALMAAYRHNRSATISAMRATAGRNTLPAVLGVPQKASGRAALERTGLTTVELRLIGEIGGFGVGVDDVARALADARDAQEVRVLIDSRGGDLIDGIGICNLLRQHPGLVHAEVVGMAGSAASVALQGADVRSIGQGAQVAVHNPSAMAVGTAADMLAAAEELDRTADAVAGIYQARCGGRRDTWRNRMRQETTYNGPEAVAAGLADTAEE